MTMGQNVPKRDAQHLRDAWKAIFLFHIVDTLYLLGNHTIWMI